MKHAHLLAIAPRGVCPEPVAPPLHPFHCLHLVTDCLPYWLSSPLHKSFLSKILNLLHATMHTCQRHVSALRGLSSNLQHLQQICADQSIALSFRRSFYAAQRNPALQLITFGAQKSEVRLDHTHTENLLRNKRSRTPRSHSNPRSPSEQPPALCPQA